MKSASDKTFNNSVWVLVRGKWQFVGLKQETVPDLEKMREWIQEVAAGCKDDPQLREVQQLYVVTEEAS